MVPMIYQMPMSPYPTLVQSSSLFKPRPYIIPKYLPLLEKHPSPGALCRRGAFLMFFVLRASDILYVPKSSTKTIGGKEDHYSTLIYDFIIMRLLNTRMPVKKVFLPELTDERYSRISSSLMIILSTGSPFDIRIAS